MLETWIELQPHLDSQRYEEVLKKLSTQVVDAAEWPQVCLGYFRKFSRRSISVDIPGGSTQRRDENS
jgi:alpha-glucuronidase